MVTDIINKLINIPVKFHELGNKSWNTLLQESGYLENQEEVTADKIEEALSLHSNLINDWIQYSDDNRSTPAWGFAKTDKGKYRVAHYPEGKDFQEMVTFDSFKACAYFIMCKIRSSAKYYESNKDEFTKIQ